MKKSYESTPINWIGNTKRNGDEWFYFTKKFTLNEKPDLATIKVDSQGICGIHVNGTFTEASCGRYFHRITYLDITSLLQEGENEITFKCGGHFFQPTCEGTKERSEWWYSAAAAEISIKSKENVTTIYTDDTWTCKSDEGEGAAKIFSQVNYADYKRFWENAVLMKEYKAPRIPEAIRKVAGEEYVTYANQPWQYWKEPDGIAESKQSEDKLETIYDFGKLRVGYFYIEYEADCDTEITCWFDYLEVLDDFTEKSRMPWVVNKLAIKQPVQKGRHTILMMRRRAAHYVKVDTPSGVKILDVKFRLSMMTSEQIGWFSSSDELLNQIWETGKYTLHVNKHQEYECCPRHEMKYFSADGAMTALVDYYTFGGSEVTNASMSLTEIASNVAIRQDIHNNGCGLWDFPAWRLIMAYNWYRYFNEVELIRPYYDELVTTLSWMIHRSGKDYLIYQFPIWWEPFYDQSGEVEYTCSCDRLGEKAFLNALYYKSLLCMSELAEVMGDQELADEWSKLASKVKVAFNERLWCEEKGAYLDTYDTSYVPQDGNAMAMLYGLADEAKTKRILETLKETNWCPYGSTILSRTTNHTLGGRDTMSPLMQAVEVEARFVRGDADSAIELMKRFWGTMLKKGAGTFWEYAPNDPERGWLHRCHGWGSSCTYIIGACVLGITPAEPGYEKLHFAPYDGLESFVGVVPTVKGLVAVKCATASNKKKYELVIPKGIQLETVLPKDATLVVTEYEES